MLEFLFNLLSHDIGIDLGTSNTLVLVKGKGIVVKEPSAVSRHKKTKQVLAIGSAAKKMLGKTPSTIEVVRPLRNGVIADFDATAAMLKHYLREIHTAGGGWFRINKPRVVIGIPSGVTEVERRAVQDAALMAGARKAYLIEEPMAAAIGIGLPIEGSEGMLVVDIGGGTTEIAVISLGGIVIERCLRMAGDKMDEAIMAYMRLRHSVLLGEATAESLKIQLGSAYPGVAGAGERNMVVRGRDLESGLPKSFKATATEAREALSPIIQPIVEQISEVIEETPPELMSDIVAKGVTLCGGVAQLPGLDKLIAERIRIPVWVADNPMLAVVRGCGKVLENKGLLQRVKVVGGLR